MVLLCVIPFFFYKKQFFDRKTKINLPILFALFLILVPPAIVALSDLPSERDKLYLSKPFLA